MNKITYLLIAWLTSNSVFAQFSSNPLNPYAVADATNIQEGVRQLEDGAGGYFVFWLDRRDDGINRAVYGQHLDSNGNALWVPNGKPVAMHAAKNITAFRCIHFDGGLLLAWITLDQIGYGDTLWTKKIDTSGDDEWNQPTVVATKTNAISVTAIGFEIFQNDSGAFATYSMTYIGGGSALEFNRVDFNGVLRWPANSQVHTVNGYDYRACSDNHNGLYALGKGNGLGSPIFIQRFGLQGNSIWPPVDITNGGGVNGFGGNITLLPDEDGNLYCVYDGNGYRVLISKIDSSGNVIHAAVKIADYASTSAQWYSSARLIGNNIYAVWNEDRVGPTHVFVQRQDTSCARLWSDDGVMVSPSNTYCRPKIAISDSSAVAVFHTKPTNADVAIQRIRDDSTLTWPASITVGNVAGGGPTDNDAELADDAGGCNAVFWGTQGNANIYGAKLCSNGQLIDVEELPAGETGILLYPNPVSEKLTITSSLFPIERITVYSAVGQIIMDLQHESSIDVSRLAKGVYITEIVSGDKKFVERFVKD